MLSVQKTVSGIFLEVYWANAFALNRFNAVFVAGLECNFMIQGFGNGEMPCAYDIIFLEDEYRGWLTNYLNCWFHGGKIGKRTHSHPRLIRAS